MLSFDRSLCSLPVAFNASFTSPPPPPTHRSHPQFPSEIHISHNAFTYGNGCTVEICTLRSTIIIYNDMVVVGSGGGGYLSEIHVYA